jgi:AcrR family transcriptional regulator
MRSISKNLAAKLRLGAVVFAERGYDAATIEALSEATGVPSSTLYYNFAGKQEILAFLLQDWLDRTSVVVATAIEGPATAAVRLEAVIRAQLAAMAADPATCQMLLAELGRIDRLPHIADAVQQAFHRPVAKLLAEGTVDGSLAEVSIENATSVIYGAVTLTGLHHVVASNGDVPAFDADAVAGDVVGLVMNGLAARMINDNAGDGQ